MGTVTYLENAGLWVKELLPIPRNYLGVEGTVTDLQMAGQIFRLLAKGWRELLPISRLVDRRWRELLSILRPVDRRWRELLPILRLLATR